ncbi:MAG TPA: PilZ domain-containing protein [Tepidiformaceae bacterium]|nr:PilZ domain-containing protein [Tepidiformaceae bacterium]
MIVPDRRAHPRYPAWFPVNVRIDGEPAPRAGMLCDVSLGGALVWGFWSDTKAGHAVLDVSFRSERFELPAAVVSVEKQWDTVVLHLQFDPETAEDAPRLLDLIHELKTHFEAYQVYLAHRADDDPALGRTATQYPNDRASA